MVLGMTVTHASVYMPELEGIISTWVLCEDSTQTGNWFEIIQGDKGHSVVPIWENKQENNHEETKSDSKPFLIAAQKKTWNAAVQSSSATIKIRSFLGTRSPPSELLARRDRRPSHSTGNTCHSNSTFAGHDRFEFLHLGVFVWGKIQYWCHDILKLKHCIFNPFLSIRNESDVNCSRVSLFCHCHQNIARHPFQCRLARAQANRPSNRSNTPTLCITFFSTRPWDLESALCEMTRRSQWLSFASAYSKRESTFETRQFFEQRADFLLLSIFISHGSNTLES